MMIEIAQNDETSARLNTQTSLNRKWETPSVIIIGLVSCCKKREAKSE